MHVAVVEKGARGNRFTFMLESIKFFTVEPKRASMPCALNIAFNSNNNNGAESNMIFYTPIGLVRRGPRLKN